MNGHLDESQFHDYLDGLLDATERSSVDAHLAACQACRSGLADLYDVVEGLAALSRKARPERDLWPGIEARIGEPRGAATLAGEAVAEVIPMAGRGVSRRRISLTVGQLLAAGVVLATVSAGTVWMALGPGGTPDGGRVAEQGEPVAVQQVSHAYEDYDQAVEELEEILRAGRTVLDGRTVLVLEKSLAEIDSAIEEAREALAADPASPDRAWALTNNMRRKLGVLRQAAGIIQSST